MPDVADLMGWLDAELRLLMPKRSPRGARTAAGNGRPAVAKAAPAKAARAKPAAAPPAGGAGRKAG
jgi:hypothetical protein